MKEFLSSDEPALASREPGNISIIVPCWNDAAELEASMPHFLAARPGQLLIVDGGREARTADIARAAGAGYLEAPERGRSQQMNYGAAHASGNIYWFVHADTWIPREACSTIAELCARQEVAGGAFARRFRSQSLFLRWTCWLAQGRNKCIGWHLGDQAIFVKRGVFQKLGGFMVRPLFEDLDFSRRMARAGRVVTLHPPVLSSARRFEKQGVVRRTIKDFLLTVQYLRPWRE